MNMQTSAAKYYGRINPTKDGEIKRNMRSMFIHSHKNVHIHVFNNCFRSSPTKTDSFWNVIIALAVVYQHFCRISAASVADLSPWR
jgi:hypothetical protein